MDVDLFNNVNANKPGICQFFNLENIVLTSNAVTV